MGDIGTCMFVWECIKTEGKHLGTCADGFLFGSCCAHNDSKNNLIPQSSTVTVNYPSDKTTSSSVSYSESIGDFKPSVKPGLFGVTSTRPSHVKPTASTSQTKPSYLKPEIHARPPPKTSRRPTTITVPTPTSKTPVTHLTSNISSLVTIENFLTHSTTLSPVVTVQKPSLPSNNTGPQYSTKTTTTTRRPHATHKPYTSTQQSHYPSKATTNRRPHTTQRTTKYPYVQPSWKPRPTSSTTSRPHVFTFSNYYSTPKTTQVTKVSTPSSFQNVTTSSNPTTTRTTTQKISTTNKPSVSTSRKPIFSTTERTPVSSDTTTHKTLNVSMIPFFLQHFALEGKFYYLFTTELVYSISNKIAHQFWKIQYNSFSPCGVQAPHPQKKVVGGTNSAFGSWPWQASVRRTSFFGFSSTHRCGGALISHQWVATAGHCVDDLLLSQIKIRVGEYDFASAQEPHGYVERGAKKKVVHPRYNFFTYENDLALVQLEEAIDSDKYPHISPICLPPFEESLVGKNATVTGWGRLSEGGVLPSILQEVQVPIISNEKCKNMFLAAGRHEYIPDIFMCAGFEEGGRDSCQEIQADHYKYKPMKDTGSWQALFLGASAVPNPICLECAQGYPNSKTG
ncbi:serine proteinase stubble [Caerostris extrusa]|uniref:Serine proteinase stubble n=1 Tax=Caerostris extrusa TaxID=172846 RepID=A0AAV4NAU1_CAEEX|nr:serine proteinase stubble [Caerostris extrusa]